MEKMQYEEEWGHSPASCAPAYTSLVIWMWIFFNDLLFSELSNFYWVCVNMIKANSPFLWKLHTFGAANHLVISKVLYVAKIIFQIFYF